MEQGIYSSLGDGLTLHRNEFGPFDTGWMIWWFICCGQGCGGGLTFVFLLRRRHLWMW